VNGFAIPTIFQVPANGGVPAQFNLQFKAFEANTIALLETAMNAWLATLEANQAYDKPVILDVDYQSGAKERALVKWGYFSPL